MFSTVWEQMEIPSLYSEEKLYEIFQNFTVEIDKKLNYPSANIMTLAEFKEIWSAVNATSEKKPEVVTTDSTESAAESNMQKAPFVFVTVLILGFLFAFFRKRKK
jgi:multiple sugar transport system substrate-binding protein